jgi:hypothetical protein
MILANDSARSSLNPVSDAMSVVMLSELPLNVPPCPHAS